LVRKFIKETSFEFFEWTKEKAINKDERIYKAQLFEEFVTEFPDYRKWLTNKKFKKWIESYAKFIDCIYSEGHSQGGRWFEIKTKLEDAPF
jgi:hypothetical protein